VTVQRDLGDLLHGRWRRRPRVAAADGVVTLTYPRLWWSIRPGTDEIVLSSSAPWDISVHGGVRNVGADLSPLKLRSLAIDGSVSRTTLVL
jgi:hypothetical protein